MVVLLTFWNLIENAGIGILVLYGLEVIDLPPSAYGVLLSGVAVGGVLGAAVAPRLEQRWGTGTVIALTVALTVAANVGLALTRRPAVAVALLALVGLAAVGFNVVSVTYRQSVVPDRLLGRVSGAYRFATWGINPAGAALGGVVAAAYGIPAVFYAAAAVLAAAGALTLPALTDRRLAESLAALE